MYIVTKYLPATNTRGARIKAQCIDYTFKPVTVAYDYALNARENHEQAARALLQKQNDFMNYCGDTFHGASTKTGMAFIASDYKVTL